MPRLRTFVFGGLALGALVSAASAPAHADWRWHHGPRGWFRFWIAPGVVVAPPVVYAPPPPVYVPAPPVVVLPPPPSFNFVFSWSHH